MLIECASVFYVFLCCCNGDGDDIVAIGLLYMGYAGLGTWPKGLACEWACKGLGRRGTTTLQSGPFCEVLEEYAESVEVADFDLPG